MTVARGAWREGGLVELAFDRGRAFEVGVAWQAAALHGHGAALLFQLGSGPDQARCAPPHAPCQTRG